MSKTITFLYKSNIFQVWIPVDLKAGYLPDSLLGNVCLVNLNNPGNICCLNDDRYKEKYVRKFLRNPKGFIRSERPFLNFMITGDPDQTHMFRYLKPIHIIEN